MVNLLGESDAELLLAEICVRGGARDATTLGGQRWFKAGCISIPVSLVIPVRLMSNGSRLFPKCAGHSHPCC